MSRMVFFQKDWMFYAKILIMCIAVIRCLNYQKSIMNFLPLLESHNELHYKRHYNRRITSNYYAWCQLPTCDAKWRSKISIYEMAASSRRLYAIFKKGNIFRKNSAYRN